MLHASNSPFAQSLLCNNSLSILSLINLPRPKRLKIKARHRIPGSACEGVGAGVSQDLAFSCLSPTAFTYQCVLLYNQLLPDRFIKDDKTGQQNYGIFLQEDNDIHSNLNYRQCVQAGSK